MKLGIGFKVFLALTAVIIVIAGSVTFYMLLMAGDEDPLMSMKFSEKVLVETGSTPDGEDDSVASLNQFAVDIYRELAKNNTDNIFFSPLSLYIALSMAMEGARGPTFEAMRDVLRITDDNATRRGSFAAIQNDLNSRKGCELSLSNNVWIRENVRVKEDFNRTIQDYYMANIEKASFTSDPEGARKMINDRIASETHDRIMDLIPPGSIDASMAAILTNAIYFKGQWEYGFDPSDTKDGHFSLEKGGNVTVPMMSLDPKEKADMELMMMFNETLSALRMDYMEGDISMLFLLPGGYQNMVPEPSTNDIHSLEASLDSNYISSTNQGLQRSKDSVMVPKFSFETAYSMEDPLNNMGMGISFTGNADFSGMMEESLYINKVLHKAFINVDESGTEAAAATAVFAWYGASMPLSFDHPFIFLIQDNETGAILFMGRVMDPSN